MCDTYVALAPATKDGSVIFGKNSDRTQDEIQLITYAPRTTYSKGDELKCTNISIPQVSETAAIILSQPWWIWGAEMGANESGVVIGNEAVMTKEPLEKAGLLGMDILRLGLERSKNSKEALQITTELLEQFGQGGAHQKKGTNYHNTYIIADFNEAYILETAGKWWVAEKVKEFRSISNDLSIRGKGDLRRDGIVEYAIEKGYCKDDNDFDFAVSFGSPQPLPSYMNCSMGQLSKKKGEITPEIMMNFLKEHDGNICRHKRNDLTAGSQVSHLRKDKKSVHWFTGSMLTCLSIFKPYAFPIKEQRVLDSKAYNEVNNSWYWIKHADFVKQFIRNPTKENPERADLQLKITKIQSDLYNQIVELNQFDGSDNVFIDKINTINNLAWRESEKLIK